MIKRLQEPGDDLLDYLRDYLDDATSAPEIIEEDNSQDAIDSLIKLERIMKWVMISVILLSLAGVGIIIIW